MNKTELSETEGKTYYFNDRGIPKGCQLCLKGLKTVLFLNGICQHPPHCRWYCPISKTRKDKNHTFANEIKIFSMEELIDEIRITQSRGMSVTGGEPLAKGNINETIGYISYVKSEIGSDFHVHLYTNGLTFTEEIAEKLAQCGLNEIRFNTPPDIISNIRFALNKGMSVGAEVPVIPKKQHIKNIERLILYLDKIGADFVNLNEFEMCYPNSEALKERGFILEDGTIASVSQSNADALNLIKKMQSRVKIMLHYCPIISKDYYQLKNRYIRRADSIKLPHETITSEGLLLWAEVRGNRADIALLKTMLIQKMKIPIQFIQEDQEILKISYEYAIKDDFISLIEKKKLKCHIMESIPLRGEYTQITEKTPIRVFKRELNDYEN
ncbi:MAG: radical SAM protein [Candidatus Lokiarchaeota archaeon]|nr:radical SAM protein [Candidatus Lokiarchaeota archaeon]MBD3338412.1 radical SAM protein [Candidatus Lokiarchaeota archaeon]